MSNIEKQRVEHLQKAVEFGEYLAKSAEQFRRVAHDLTSARFALDEADSAGAESRAKDVVDQAEQVFSEYFSALERDIYEFRKRVHRIPSAAAPGESVVYAGYIQLPGAARQAFEFKAPAGAQQGDIDAAALAAVMKVAEVNYLEMGRANLADEESEGEGISAEAPKA